MKLKSIIAIAALLGVFASSASALTTVAPAKAAEPVKFEAPSLSKFIAPVMLPTRHEGSMVNLSMTVDANGKPTHVRVKGASDQDAYKHLIATVSQWEFAPARKNGKAVSSKVELPLEVKGL